jgi:hypothetical protein
LHGEVDEFRVGRGLAEGDGKKGYPLEVEGLGGGNCQECAGSGGRGIKPGTHNVRPDIGFRENGSGLGCCDHKVGNDGHAFDLLGPGEGDVVSNPMRRLRWHLAGIDPACWCGQDLTQGNLNPRNLFRS